ncbi:MAG: thioredoxin [Gammaproteobacteria bacterium]|nr:MAG: thioredoxin [Gammaproteobacteria bacterium]
MSDSPYIFEGTPENFEELVIQSSESVPVLVDFWAAWCNPCQILLPIVTKLAEEYQGKFLLVKVNSDEQQQLAAQFGVRSLPTLKLFRNGQVVEEIMGAQPEPALRAILDKYIQRESDLIREAALDLARQGQAAQASEMLVNAQQDDPENTRIAIDLARVALLDGNVELAENTIQSMPHEIRNSEEANEILGQVQFAKIITSPEEVDELVQKLEIDPESLEMRQQLAARYVLTGNYEPALQLLLEIMQKDRDFGDDAGRKGMLAVFDILHGEGDLVNRYRRQMFNLLH